MLPQDLHRDGALTGDDVGIVVGVDEDQTLLGLELAGEGVRLVVAVALEHAPRRRGPARPGP